MKTIAKLIALCLLLGTFAFAQTTTAPSSDTKKADDTKTASTDTKDAKGKKAKKGKKEKKGDEKGADQKAPEPPK